MEALTPRAFQARVKTLLMKRCPYSKTEIWTMTVVMEEFTAGVY